MFVIENGNTTDKDWRLRDASTVDSLEQAVEIAKAESDGGRFPVRVWRWADCTSVQGPFIETVPGRSPVYEQNWSSRIGGG